MVDLARTTPETIDRELARAERSWGRLPEISEAIDRWPDDKAEDFLNEWSLEEDNLSGLRERAARAELTPEQQARYERLLEMVTRYRPIIACLMDGTAARP
jgi:hypothetical protein